MKKRALGLREERKERGSLAQPLREEFPRNPKRDWTRIPKSCQNQERGSLRSAGKNQLGVRQLREACSWTQGTKIDMSHQPPMIQKKVGDLGISTS